MRRSSTVAPSSGPDVRGEFVLARSPESTGAVLRDNGAAAPTPHFFALKEGQPSGWPSRASPHGRARQSPAGPERSGGPA